MKLSCPSCHASFVIKNTNLLSGQTNYVKCCKCYHIWDIKQFLQYENKQNNEEAKILSKKNITIQNTVIHDNDKQNSLTNKITNDNKRNKVKKPFYTYMIYIILFACMLLGVSGAFIIEKKQNSFSASHFTIKNAVYQKYENQLIIKVDLTNLANKSIMLNTVKVICMNGKYDIVQVIKLPPILLKPMMLTQFINKVTLDKKYIDKISSIKFKIY